jgi:hypothetical protein
MCFLGKAEKIAGPRASLGTRRAFLVSALTYRLGGRAAERYDSLAFSGRAGSISVSCPKRAKGCRLIRQPFIWFFAPRFGEFCRRPGRRPFLQALHPGKERGATGDHEKLQAAFFDVCNAAWRIGRPRSPAVPSWIAGKIPPRARSRFEARHRLTDKTSVRNRPARALSSISA